MKPCSQVNHVMSKYDHIASGFRTYIQAIHNERKGYKVAKRSYLAGLHSLQEQLNVKGLYVVNNHVHVLKWSCKTKVPDRTKQM